MVTLFSYCVRHDAGAAPNPFWGVCSLVICKPRIRRVAQVGDWVVGTGSRRSPIGDLSESVVYAMRVGRKMTMAEYDEWAAAECPGKVPDPGHLDHRRAVGDAVYEFSSDPPRVRPSVHTEANREHDLSGEYALLGDQFVYFSRAAVPLPQELRRLVKRGPAHRSIRDPAVIDQFCEWLAGLGHPWGTVLGLPAGWPTDTVITSLTVRGRAPNRSMQQSEPARRPSQVCRLPSWPDS